MTSGWWRRATLGIALGSLLQCSEPSYAATSRNVTWPRHIPANYTSFCHDLDYVLQRTERSACHYAEASIAQCPGLYAACQRLPEPERGAGRILLGPNAGEAMQEDSGANSGSPEPWSLSTRQWPWLLGTLAALSLLTSFAFARTLFTRRKRPRTGSPSPRAESPSNSSITDVDASRLLEAAREYLELGQHQRAFVLTYFALLFDLDQRGWVRYSSARTNQDYVRAVAAYPEAQQLLVTSGAELDALRFAGHQVRPERAREYLDAVVRFIEPSARLLTAMCLCVALAWGCSGTMDATGDNSPAWAQLTDQGPSGMSLLASMLEQEKRQVTYHVGPHESLLEREGTLIVYDQRTVPPEAWYALSRWATGSNQLVIVGPGAGASHFGHVVHPLNCPEFVPNPDSGLRFAPPPAGFFPDPSAAVDCAFERFASHPQDARGVLLLPTVAMLSNAALVSADNARLLLLLLGSGSVTFVGGLSDENGSQSPYDAVSKLQAGPWLAQLALFLLALYLARGTAFGIPRQPPSAPRRDLLEHVRALGATLARARASNHALNHYAHFTLGQLRTELAPGAAQSPSKLAAAIAARTRTPESDIRDWLERLAEARERAPDPAYHAEDLEFMRTLHRLVTRSRGDRE